MRPKKRDTATKVYSTYKESKNFYFETQNGILISVSKTLNFRFEICYIIKILNFSL